MKMWKSYVFLLILFNGVAATSQTPPDENKFVKTVLASDMDSPMELVVADDGRIFYTELPGRLSVYDMKTKTSKLVHKFSVPPYRGSGLIGITLDPDFNKNNYIYLYYTPGRFPKDSIQFFLSRFVLTKDNKLDTLSEKVFFTVPIKTNVGAHYGGSLKFDKEGNLFISTGDGTTPFPSNGYAPLDERPGHDSLDAQRSASNTNSLQGKILRIRPQPDGSYTIPEGNLFPKGTEGARPEIYVMGARNPYRIAVNPKTSVLYWGDIGPDAGKDSLRGPKGYDEFNQAKEPGNYGWPYFIGNNQAYPKWDFTANAAGPLYDTAAPVNNSVNNTGLKKLPPAKRAMIWYPYLMSKEFPGLGEGGRCAIAGDFYTYNANGGSPNKFPRYYDGALFIGEWMRNWVKVVRLDENENYKRMESFMPLTGDFRRPIDMCFGKDGVLYMLEYGSVYGAANKDARLVKIEYYPKAKPKQPAKEQISKPVIAKTAIHPGKIIMDNKACHQFNAKAVGPSYMDIINRYKKQNGSVQKLAAKIISGGAGNWGTEALMSAHPQLTTKQAEQIVEYIFSMTDKK
jgi:cytochrome c